MSEEWTMGGLFHAQAHWSNWDSPSLSIYCVSTTAVVYGSVIRSATGWTHINLIFKYLKIFWNDILVVVWAQIPYFGILSRFVVENTRYAS